MHALLLTWEFPPRVIGQIGRDVETIATKLVNSDCKVDVISYHDHLAGMEERPEGFRVHRVTNPVQTHLNIVTWALTFNTELQRVAANIILESSDNARLVHAFEWLTVPAAIQLKKTFGVPYFLSLYSLESERSGGGPLSESIKYFEKVGILEASRTSVSNATSADMLGKEYGVPKNGLVILDASDDCREALLAQYRAMLVSAKRPLKTQ